MDRAAVEAVERLTEGAMEHTSPREAIMNVLASSQFKRTVLWGMLVAAMIILMTACSSSKGYDQASYCPIPTGYNLDKAVEQGLKTVRNCNEKYDEVFAALLDIAATDADPENKTKLYQFSRTLVDEKVIPADKTRESFREYFDADFVCIPVNSVSVATQCRTANALKDEMSVELDKKKVGFQQVLGDEQGYVDVRNSYTRFIDSLDIVCSTYEDGAASW
jgi:hypothetical protein